MNNVAHLSAAGNKGLMVGQNLGSINIDSHRLTEADKIAKCIDALRVTDPEMDREFVTSSKGIPVQGTCDWVQRDPNFCQWLDAPSSQTLWIAGGLGKGKTMISVYLIDVLQKTCKSRNQTFAYFFCDYRDVNRNSACAVLQSILFQVIQQRPTLHHHIYNYVRDDTRAKDTLMSRDALWLILQRVLQEQGLGSLVYVLDGLDECDNESMRWMAVKLTSLNCTDSTYDEKREFKFLIASRDVAGLQCSFKIDLDILGTPAYNQGIITFIQARAAEMRRTVPGCTEALQSHVEERLQKRSGNSFLWVGCVMDELSLKETPTDIESSLDEFPIGLRPMYDRLLGQIHVQHRVICVSVLQWVAQAMKPLTLAELAAALEITDSKLVSAEQGVRDRVRWCKTLVKIQHPKNCALTPTVDLVHYSLKEHLLTARDLADINIQPFFFLSQGSHLYIAQKCFEYLHAHLAGTEYWFCDDERAMITFPLTSYATQYWPEHARLAGEQVTTLLETKSDFFGDSGMAYTNWWLAYRMTSHPGLKVEVPFWFADKISGPATKRDQVIPPMQLAAALGIRLWMTRRVEIEARGKGIVSDHDRRDQSPLHYAVQRGHTDVVGWLLEREAIIDDRAVFAAAAEGHARILELLLERGGNPNARAINRRLIDQEGETAIWNACGSGFEDVVHVLLKHGADPNALSPNENVPPGQRPPGPISIGSLSNGRPTPAFVAACLGGNKSLVEQLLPLTKNVQEHIQSGFLMALTFARDAVIRFLVDHPHLSQITHDSAREKRVYYLALLVQVPAPTIEILLHRFGTNVDLLVSWDKDDAPRTMIEMAAYAPDLDSISMLLSKGARIRTNHPTTQRIVQFAIEKDHADIVEHLFRQQVSMDLSLHLAAKHGSLEAARVVITKNVAVNSINKEKQTPLMIAAENGHLELVKRFLEHGAFVRLKDKWGKTAGMRAEAGGHEAVARVINEWMMKDEN